MIVTWKGRNRAGDLVHGRLELEPLELELLVRRRWRAGWQELELLEGELVVGRIEPKQPGRRRVWWVQVPMGLGQQRLEL